MFPEIKARIENVLMMIEVFKTNINDQLRASMLIDKIHGSFDNCIANFDLEDCDNILRVKCTSGSIEPLLLIDFLRAFGCIAETLPDVVNSIDQVFPDFADTA